MEPAEALVRRWITHQAYRGFAEATRRCELRRQEIPGRPHDLRAAFGTELARITNGNLVMVAALMGHESVQTTQVYVGWQPDATAAVASLFAA